MELKSRRRSKRSSRRTSKRIDSLLRGLPYLLVLVSKIVLLYFKLSAKRRRAVKSFKTRLKESGMAEEHIQDLAGTYEDMGKLRRCIDLADVLHFSF